MTSPTAPRPGQDHILIVGPGKTGTTGLFASVRRGLVDAGHHFTSVFEPSNARRLDKVLFYAPGTPMLVKTTMDTASKSVPEPRVFDRLVMTVRDPRDILLSSLLFRPLTVASMERTDEATVARFITALEAKQADPASTSVRALFELCAEIGIGALPFQSILDSFTAQQKFLERHPVHVMQYERFVTNDLGGLSEYLGFPVENVSAASSGMFGYITRSKGSGEWKQWFRPDDVAFVNDMFGEAMTRFGYDLDVELPESQVIDPSTGSEYVRKGYDSRRGHRKRMISAREETWRPTDVATTEALQTLIDYGSDGDATACARVAEVLVSGHLGAEVGGPAEALRWARSSAEYGSPAGMRLMAKLLGTYAGDDPVLQRELRRWRYAARVVPGLAKTPRDVPMAGVATAAGATPGRFGELAAVGRAQGTRIARRVGREIRARRAAGGASTRSRRT